jgi:hypothetical protein
MIRRPQTVVSIEQKDVDIMKALRKDRLPGQPSNVVDQTADKSNVTSKSSKTLGKTEAPAIALIQFQEEERRRKTVAERMGLL